MSAGAAFGSAGGFGASAGFGAGFGDGGGFGSVSGFGDGGGFSAGGFGGDGAAPKDPASEPAPMPVADPPAPEVSMLGPAEPSMFAASGPAPPGTMGAPLAPLNDFAEALPARGTEKLESEAFGGAMMSTPTHGAAARPRPPAASALAPAPTLPPPDGWPAWLPAPSADDLAGSAALYALLAGEKRGASAGARRLRLEQLLEFVGDMAMTLQADGHGHGAPADADAETTLSSDAFDALWHALRVAARPAAGAPPLPAPIDEAARRVRVAAQQAATPAAQAKAKAAYAAEEAAALQAAARAKALEAAEAADAAAAADRMARSAASHAEAEAAAKAFRAAMEAEAAARAKAQAAEAEAAARAALKLASVGGVAASPAAAPPMTTTLTPGSAIPITPLAPHASPPLPPPTEANRQRYAQIFMVLHTDRALVGPPKEKSLSVLRKSRLPDEALEHIWRLADVDGDGVLDPEEFILAMHLTNVKVKMKVALPDTLPPALVPAGKG